MVFLELELWKILTILNVMFGLIILFIAINLIMRFYGKLKKAMIFLTSALIILTVSSFLRLFDLIPQLYLGYSGLIMNFLITLFIFLTLFNMKQIVNSIDHHYNHNMKKRRK